MARPKHGLAGMVEHAWRSGGGGTMFQQAPEIIPGRGRVGASRGETTPRPGTAPPALPTAPPPAAPAPTAPVVYPNGLRPTTDDPYDRGHYVYDENGNILGYTEEYAKIARRNYDNLQGAIDKVDNVFWPTSLGLSLFGNKVPRPLNPLLLAAEGSLWLQDKVPPPPGPAQKPKSAK